MIFTAYVWACVYRPCLNSSWDKHYHSTQRTENCNFQPKKKISQSLSWTSKALQENTSTETLGIILFLSIHGSIFPLTSPLACSLPRALDTHLAQTALKMTVCSAFPLLQHYLPSAGSCERFSHGNWRPVQTRPYLPLSTHLGME